MMCMMLIINISSALSIPGVTMPMTAMMTLNGTNYHQWRKTLMLNLTVMKLDLALKINQPQKPTNESIVNDKKVYEEWEYSNNCCMLILEYYVEDSIF